MREENINKILARVAPIIPVSCPRMPNICLDAAFFELSAIHKQQLLLVSNNQRLERDQD